MSARYSLKEKYEIFRDAKHLSFNNANVELSESDVKAIIREIVKDFREKNQIDVNVYSVNIYQYMMSEIIWFKIFKWQFWKNKFN